MDKKQTALINELRGILEEIDMECIQSDDFGEKISGLDIFSRNINDIVDDLSDVE